MALNNCFSARHNIRMWVAASGRELGVCSKVLPHVFFAGVEPVPQDESQLPGLSGAFRVTRFVEKPDAETARAFIGDGGYLWNSGMFVFSAARYLEELERFRPDVAAGAAAAWQKGARDLDFLRLDAAAFGACPSVSVDYAVMERTGSAAVVSADMGWSDVGSWTALWEVGEKDAAGNVIRGDVHLQDARGCYIRSEGRFVSVIGARDLLVVETDDAVLVAELLIFTKLHDNDKPSFPRRRESSVAQRKLLDPRFRGDDGNVSCGYVILNSSRPGGEGSRSAPG